MWLALVVSDVTISPARTPVSSAINATGSIPRPPCRISAGKFSAWAARRSWAAPWPGQRWNSAIVAIYTRTDGSSRRLIH